VAAENFYGDVAKQVGGSRVAVSSILANPDQDPHLFEVSPSVARAVSAAKVVICNGIDYDHWMERLLAATPAPARQVVVVAALAGRKPGDNPHIWYRPETMALLADALAARYAALDPAHAADYAKRFADFQASLAPIQARIASMRLRLQGTQVTATEPVFGYMFEALGMVSRNQAFQRAVMNETEASASDVIAFEDDLRSHRVKLFLFNRQASDTVADRMKAIALTAGVPVVGATETEPAGMRYQAWISAELDAVDRAVPPPAH
jgi:zinc/manganese transport system substrate-binding protein